MLTKQLGFTTNLPLTGGGVTLIDAVSIDLKARDSQGIPLSIPTQAVMTIRGAQAGGAFAAVIGRSVVTWGTLGGRQQLILNGNFATDGYDIRMGNNLLLPLKGDYFRLDVGPSTVAQQIISAHVGEGFCERPIVLSGTSQNNFSTGPGSISAFPIPPFAKRFRVTRIPQSTPMVISDNFTAGVASGSFEIDVPANNEMDWAPCDESFNNIGNPVGINVMNNGAGAALQANCWFELYL